MFESFKFYGGKKEELAAAEKIEAEAANARSRESLGLPPKQNIETEKPKTSEELRGEVIVWLRSEKGFSEDQIMKLTQQDLNWYATQKLNESVREMNKRGLFN